MDESLLLAMIVAAAVGLAATVFILQRDRHAAAVAGGGVTESPFAVSTEGEKRCPSCGMGNLVTDATCVTCGARLPG
ncbi:MAG TPA: hypothetical protein VGK63_01885 [Candidatus Limnocylindrales bacterium]